MRHLCHAFAKICIQVQELAAAATLTCVVTSLDAADGKFMCRNQSIKKVQATAFKAGVVKLNHYFAVKMYLCSR